MTRRADSNRKAQLFLTLPELLLIQEALKRSADSQLDADALTGLHLAAILEMQHKVEQAFSKYLRN